MILDSDLEVAPAAREPEAGKHVERASLFPWAFRFYFLVLLCAVIGLQVLSGAYRSEFSSYPDEPAHYVTSLMVSDYIRHFHFESPLKFAQAYYDHYPKVALGHWPPFFYVVQAVWILIFSPSRTSIRVEIALTTALLAYSIFIEIRRRFGWKAACLASLLCVCLPLVQTYSSEEMAEMLLTLVCFWSTIYFARYLESERWQDGAWFGVFFSLAVLTKGNGWLLAMVPPIAVVLMRKVRLLVKPSLLSAVVLVAVLCVPWQWMTMAMAERGWEGGTKPSVRYTLGALWEFLTLFPDILGSVLLSVMVIGIFAAIVFPWFRRGITAPSATMFALLIAVWVFHALVPAGVEDRKLIIAVPAMIYFLVAGLYWLADYVPFGPLTRWRMAIFACAMMAFFALQTFTIPRVVHYGFDEAARFITARSQSEQSRILVSSNSVGEGLLVSELAMLRPEPTSTVLRATKVLATVEWNGSRYRCLFKSAPEVQRFLLQQDIRMIVLDRFPPAVRYAHDDLLRQAVLGSGRFHLVGTFPRSVPEVPGKIEVYSSGS